MAVRLGVDVGGTFTDLILFDESSGSVRVGKTLTQPAAIADGVAAVIDGAAEPGSLDRDALFVHGTTVGLNALLERKGAPVGLLTTSGFRDVLELRRGEREHMYDLLWRPADPLVPRRLRLPIGERTRADGELLTPVDGEDVRRAVDVLAAEKIGSVAVVCINSYANPAHELEIGDLLREHGFEGEISLSHVVSGEYREYERASTTVIDAYIRPLMTRYLGGLAERLRGLGLGDRLFVTTSGGGAMSFAEAGARPFETISSGPAGGAVGAAALCSRLGLPAAITADVGGTSFDTCFIENGRPRVAFEGHVADLVIQAPWIDVRSVGAGGGSIGWVDPSGLLRVGPASAGADPGPASYGRGGEQPTVTDAALVLGMLAFGDLADDVRLDRDRALAALEPLGAALGMEVDAVARGVLSIANARMADAIREVLGEQGQDPRDAALIAFGGAGPLFATLLASELEIAKIVVPAHAGNFSAWGLLQQDILQSAARTSVANLDAAGIEATNRVLGELFDQLAQRPSPTSSSKQEAALDMRYAGQDYTLTVAVPLVDGRLPADTEALAAAFAAEFERTFGHSMDLSVEIVAVRASLRSPLAAEVSSQGVGGESTPAPSRSLSAYSFVLGEWATFEVLQRASLATGEVLHGPAIVVEGTTTVYVDAGYWVALDESGALVIERSPAELTAESMASVGARG